MKEERKGKPKKVRQEENSYNPNRGTDPEESNKNIHQRKHTVILPNSSTTHTHTERNAYTHTHTTHTHTHTHTNTERNAYTQPCSQCQTAGLPLVSLTYLHFSHCHSDVGADSMCVYMCTCWVFIELWRQHGEPLPMYNRLDPLNHPSWQQWDKLEL